MKKSLRVPLIAMITAIVVIVSFQGWWLTQTYKDQKSLLRRNLSNTLRESVWQVQAAKLKLDSNVQKLLGGNKDGIIMMMNGMRRRMRDSTNVKEVKDKVLTFQLKRKIDSDIDTTTTNSLTFRDKIDGLLIDIDENQDPLTLKELSDTLVQQLKKTTPSISFELVKDTLRRKREARDNNDRIETTIGILHPVIYRLRLMDETGFLLKKLLPQILFSIFLIGITVASFLSLYKNLRRQQRLTELKNDFINNITHELKTPIATVSVAIEALKNFNAIHDPVRTKEYLDISGNELNRLSMLVDKVLKMSMFEKREMELKKEPIDLQVLVGEVVQSMQLQFERVHAQVHVKTEGSGFTLNADKLHITNIVYNLLDNSLKYGKEYEPKIDILVIGKEKEVWLQVTDNGIGIPVTYQSKIFEKFFRVPHGDTHNIKGYGLGLSYVAQVVREHGGKIDVTSEEGKGSSFKVCLPK